MFQGKVLQQSDVFVKRNPTKETFMNETVSPERFL